MKSWHTLFTVALLLVALYTTKEIIDLRMSHVYVTDYPDTTRICTRENVTCVGTFVNRNQPEVLYVCSDYVKILVKPERDVCVERRKFTNLTEETNGRL